MKQIVLVTATIATALVSGLAIRSSAQPPSDIPIETTGVYAKQPRETVLMGTREDARAELTFDRESDRLADTSIVVVWNESQRKNVMTIGRSEMGDNL